MDYKSVFTNLCLELQQNRSWIKGLGKNPFTHSIPFTHSFPDGSAFCPGAPKSVPSDSEKHRRVYMSSNVCHSHEWRVDTTSGTTLKKQNACLHAVRHAVGKKIACIHGLRSEGVKPKIFCINFLFVLFIYILTVPVSNWVIQSYGWRSHKLYICLCLGHWSKGWIA